MLTQHHRTISLIGEENHNLISSKKVMIIGLGAVGGYALECLARIGIKNLIVVDFDTFEPSNLNRQILATHSTLNTQKSISAQNRILDINPSSTPLALDIKLTPHNLDFITFHQPDFVIDAIDDTSAKTSLIEFLITHNIPFISALGAALKYNPEQLTTTTLDKTSSCPLAKKLRTNLRSKNLPLNQINVTYSKEPSQISKDNNGNNVLGSLPFVPMSMGASLAFFAFQTLINNGEKNEK